MLKRSYRNELRSACASSLTMTPKKPEFLEAWNKARKKAFTLANIAAGWRATGIFPRDRSKPLNSRLARDLDRDRVKRPSTPERRAPELDSLAVVSAVTFQIPTSARQLAEIARNLRGVDDAFDRPTFRLLTRKVCKTLHDNSTQIASLTQERD